MNGLITTMSLPRSINTEVSLTYVREIHSLNYGKELCRANRLKSRRRGDACGKGVALWTKKLSIMQRRIREIINQAGARLIFLPPYPLDLSPT